MKTRLNYLYLFFVKNWKTTLAGVLLGIFTLMFYMGKMEADSYLLLIGSIAAIIGIFAKDADKRGVIKPEDNP